MGLVAVCLPFILLIPSAAPQVCLRDSISHFYYQPVLGSIFIGVLFFISFFLLAYEGKTDFQNKITSWAALLPIVVAVIPTGGQGCEAGLAFSQAFFVEGQEGPQFFLQENFAKVHLAAAGLFFVSLMYFVYCVMRQVEDWQRDAAGIPNSIKQKRNRFYKASTIVMFVSIAAIGVQSVADHLGYGLPSWNKFNLTFWAEFFAMEAFGFAWLVHGRFLKSWDDSHYKTAA